MSSGDFSNTTFSLNYSKEFSMVLVTVFITVIGCIRKNELNQRKTPKTSKKGTNIGWEKKKDLYVELILIKLIKRPTNASCYKPHWQWNLCIIQCHYILIWIWKISNDVASFHIKCILHVCKTKTMKIDVISNIKLYS